MLEDKKDAYLFLLYKVLVEIRVNSSIYSRLKLLDQDEIYEYIKNINRLADAFHNLPLFLQSSPSTNEKFDEETYLKFIANSQPKYKKMLDDLLKAI